MSEYVIQTTNLVKDFKKFRAVDNVNLNIKRGEIYGLIGKNGAGKTTLLKMITSLISKTEGKISLFGAENQKEYTNQLRRVGSVIETPVAYPNLTAEQNLKYYCTQYGVADTSMVQKTLQKVGLKDTGKKKFKDFSLGMKQRLGIAIALIGNPDLLILDEPINGLDPIGIMEFRQLMEKLNQEEQVTIIISSHILSELYHVATTFGFIEKGQLINELTKTEFDELVNEAVSFKVEDVTQAVTVMENTFADISYKVLDDKEVRIYNHLNDAAQINMQLNLAGLPVFEMARKGADLEEYFKDLVMTGGNKNVENN